MRALIRQAVVHVDAFLRRCWLAWRYMLVMNDKPAVAWNKARRPS